MSELRQQSDNRINPSARRKARQLALQALYQWHMAQANVSDIEAQFRTDNDFDKIDGEYFSELLLNIPKLLDEVDGGIEPLLDRGLDELDPIERAILRIGAYELLHRHDVPYRVVINEGIELAKRFGASESHRYVNGILDKMAAKVRSPEVKSHRKP
ncbi:transcription antitermination factor NusB [Aestuariirhabdus litorea]|uniref:Transcription antitermination protein NusB n=1 Tax=Aestuariirhabdus litorea TaxID=2528527 RepID=A0A3P3VLH7_9GAMM|nr:transcription antitermination factor NusB [Aestuariirhabdus litorea]RWW96822.1 transcription antitermination factor NusB [Endozoicomonadaceae bacterium GTF-13]